jgi:hypothetical protein
MGSIRNGTANGLPRYRVPQVLPGLKPREVRRLCGLARVTEDRKVVHGKCYVEMTEGK